MKKRKSARAWVQNVKKIFHFSHWGEDFTENAGKGKNRKSEKKKRQK